MTRPTVSACASVATELAVEKPQTAGRPRREMSMPTSKSPCRGWRPLTRSGPARRLERHAAKRWHVGRASDALARAMVMAAVAARDGADQIAAARDRVLDLVAAAESEGFAVADDGTVSMDAGPTSLLVALSGGDASVAADLLALRARRADPADRRRPRTARCRRCRRRRRRRGSVRHAGFSCARDRAGRGLAGPATWWPVGRR